MSFLGIAGGIASILGGLLKKKKKKDTDPYSGGGLDIPGALLGLGESLLGGAAKSSEAKRTKADLYELMGKQQEELYKLRGAKKGEYEEQLGQLKPGGAYSGGVDPVVAAAIQNTFASRGMSGFGAPGGAAPAQAPPMMESVPQPEQLPTTNTGAGGITKVRKATLKRMGKARRY